MAAPMRTGSGEKRGWGSPVRERGVSYLWVLVTVALLTVGSALAAVLYATDAKREREAELLRIGREFRAALVAYHEASPGAKQYPRSLDDLVRDPRHPGTKRYLRRIYPDPMTGKTEWGVVRIGDQIMGVHSLSDAAPLKVGNFEPDEAAFAGKGKYSEWVFLVEPPMAQSAPLKEGGTVAVDAPSASATGKP